MISEIIMRALFLILCIISAFETHGMRVIQPIKRETLREIERVGCIMPEDRQIVLDEFRRVRNEELKNESPSIFKSDDSIDYISYRIDERCSATTYLIKTKYKNLLTKSSFLWTMFALYLNIGAMTYERFEEHVATCMSIPYVRESATGLAVEAFIKRLELACQPATDQTKRKKRNKATVERAPDFSVLEAFRDDDFQNVINMNNEWLAHHDDPEYDHGAPMYWFPDLDLKLAGSLQDVMPKLINIAMMYNYPEQQRKAWDILYTWKEYISSK